MFDKKDRLKRCNKCKIIKPTSCFSLRKNRNNRPESYCKECNTNRAKEYYYVNIEKCKLKNKQFFVENPDYCRKYELKNKDKLKEKRLKYYIKNKKYNQRFILKNKEHNKEYYLKNRNVLIKLAIKNQLKKRQTIRGALDHRMSVAIRASLSKEIKNGHTWKQFVDYTTKELKEHLENTMTSFMTWNLFMNGKIHIDHITPKSWFTYFTPEDEEFKKCWALNNLQLLWATENLKKSGKII